MVNLQVILPGRKQGNLSSSLCVSIVVSVTGIQCEEEAITMMVVILCVGYVAY